MLTALFVAAHLMAVPKGPALHLANQAESAPQEETVVATQVHGNAVTTADEVLKLGGVTIGMPATADTIDAIAERLRASGQFDQVDVRKRFVSLDDPSQVLLVVIVDEGPLRIERTGNPDAPTRVVRAGRFRPMILPILGVEDGYGLQYGVRFTLPDAFGRNSRISMPLSWGGHKQAAVEVEQRFERGPLTRVAGGGAIERRTNPFFDEDHDRLRLWGRAERAVWGDLRAGVTVGWEGVSFAAFDDHILRTSVDLVYDSRLDPFLARNAAYGRVSRERLSFREGPAAWRTSMEARGYIGLLGQTTLVVRGVKEDADRPLPPYLWPLLGGEQNLRGFKAGNDAGETLVAGTAELRVPLTSPLGVGRAGVSAFVDVGSVYAEGERLEDQRLERGYGGGVWVSLPVLRLSVSVAHGINGPTRVHVMSGMTF